MNKNLHPKFCSYCFFMYITLFKCLYARFIPDHNGAVMRCFTNVASSINVVSYLFMMLVHSFSKVDGAALATAPDPLEDNV